MAPSNSSTKKLAKVARTGKKRTIRESSDRTYPLAIMAIVLVGSLAVFWGRSQRASAQRIEPRLSDHWHAAYGTYLCDAFAPAPADAGPDETGIHSHEDGIIHIHPFTSAAAGERATIAKFWDTIGFEVSDNKLTLRDGTVYETGKTTCPSGETGKLVLVQWQSADDTAAAPTVIDLDLTGTRFVNDRMAFTLAFVPEAKIAEIPRPESIPNLDNLSDVQTTLPAGLTTDATVPAATTDSTLAGTASTTTSGSVSSTTAAVSTTTGG